MDKNRRNVANQVNRSEKELPAGYREINRDSRERFAMRNDERYGGERGVRRESEGDRYDDKGGRGGDVRKSDDFRKDGDQINRRERSPDFRDNRFERGDGYRREKEVEYQRSANRNSSRDNRDGYAKYRDRSRSPVERYRGNDRGWDNDREMKGRYERDGGRRREAMAGPRR